MLYILGGLSLLSVPRFLFFRMVGGVILFTRGMFLLLFSLSVMFGMPFALFWAKWSGGDLYGINTFRVSPSYYGLQFVRPFRLKISSYLMISFVVVSCMGVVMKMLITYFLIAPFLSASGLTCALNALFLSIIILWLSPLYDFLSWVEVNLWLLDWCHPLQFTTSRGRNVRLHGEASRNDQVVYSDIVQCIVMKVNLYHNMASSDTNNRRLHIAWRFADDIFNSRWFLLFWC